MCASPIDYEIDDWEASMGAFAQGLVARASLVKSRATAFVERFPEARPVYKEPGEILQCCCALWRLSVEATFMMDPCLLDTWHLTSILL